MSSFHTYEMVPVTCVECRRTFRRIRDNDLIRVCSHCGASAYAMEKRFRPPKKSDDAQWAKVRLLVEHGFLFQRVFETVNAEGNWTQMVPYPKTLEAKVFIAKYATQAIKLPS